MKKTSYVPYGKILKPTSDANDKINPDEFMVYGFKL